MPSISHRTNHQNHKQTVADGNIAELREAQRKIQELEIKIQMLETRIPRKHPEVLYLNYKSRKRILVMEKLISFLANFNVN